MQKLYCWLFQGFQLIPSALLLLFRRNIVEVSVQVLVFVAIVVFNKLRFDSNQYTKVVVEQMDLKVNQTLAQINSPQLSQLYQNARAGALKYLSLIKLLKESGKEVSYSRFFTFTSSSVFY